MTNSFDTPIVFLVFNRPRTTRLVFNAIAKLRPAQLLVVADGPRQNRPEEVELCAQVRKIVQEVDWPCDLQTNFADANMGCRERVISGLNWAFSIAEEAIVLEDDCLPDPTFFPFCQQLLTRYRGDSRVAMISGNNFVARHVEDTCSYYFSQMSHIWGWATWRSAWQRYDQHLKHWPEIKAAKLLGEIFYSPRITAYWTDIFDRMYAGTGPNTWDYQWTYTLLVNNALSITPRVNMVENIGFSKNATHTTAIDPALALAAQSIEFPLKHPVAMIPSRSLDYRDQLISLPRPLLLRVIKRLRNLKKSRHSS